MFATGPGNLPAVWVETTKMCLFHSRPVQNPHLQLLGGRNPAVDSSIHGCCRAWLDPSVPITGSCYRAILLKVALRYRTVYRNILILVHHCLFSILWPPSYSSKRDTHSLPNPGNVSQRSVNNFLSCIFGNQSGNWLQTFRNKVFVALIIKRESDMLPAPF